jgi:hypothetical protein
LAIMLPFPSKKPDQEVIYLEILPDSKPFPLITMKYLHDNKLIESELTVFE